MRSTTSLVSGVQLVRDVNKKPTTGPPQVLSNEMVVATDGGNNRMHCRVGSDFFGAKDRAGGGVANNPCVDATKVRIDPAKVVAKAREKRLAFEALRRAWGLGTGDQFEGGLSDAGGLPVLYLPYETLKGGGRDLWAHAARRRPASCEGLRLATVAATACWAIDAPPPSEIQFHTSQA